MAEAGIEGISIKSKKSHSEADVKIDVDKIWTLAAAPSSLSKQRQWSLLSTASSGVTSWVERTEDISDKLKKLSEDIIEQRCKVVTAPLAHHLAMADVAVDKSSSDCMDDNIRQS